MKKILLTCAVIAMTIFATEAQTKKSSGKKSKKTTMSSEAKLQADIVKIQEEKKAALDSQAMVYHIADSTRNAEEMLVEEQKAAERIAWKEQKLREVDSLNQVKWKMETEVAEQSYAAERVQNEICKSAKLNDYQRSQVSIINQEFSQKNKLISENTELTPELKSQQIATLNEEKKSRLVAVLGKSKARKLEKAQAEYDKMNTAVVKGN